MARRAGGSTIVGPKELTAEQMDQRLEEQLAQLRSQADEGRAERERMDEEFGPTEGLLPADDLEKRLVTETVAEPSQADLGQPQAQLGFDEDPQVEEDALRARQREAERRPGIIERTGMGVQRQDSGFTVTNANEAFGLEMANRLRGFGKAISDQFDPVELPLKSTTDMDPDNPLFDSQLQKFNNDDKETTLRMNKGKDALALTKSNVLLSRQGLGIGQWNPDFNPAEVNVDQDGKIINYENLTNARPAMINPVYGIALASVIEPYLLEQEARGATQGLEEQGGRPSEAGPDISVQGLGREVFKETRKMRSEIEGEPSDTYLADYKNTTPEAFDLMGAWALETYAQTNPHMVTILPGKKGEAARGYALTSEGMETLSREVAKYQKLDFDYPLMVTKSQTGGMEFEGSLARGSTGQQPSSNLESPLVQEAKKNAHDVDIVFDNQRSKIAIMAGAHAFATNPISSGRGEGGNFTHDAFDLGANRYNKIKSIPIKMKARLDKLDMDLELAQAEYARNPLPYLQYRIDKLNNDIKDTKELLEKFSKREELLKIYYQNANKHLEVLVNLSKYKGDVFHYSYFNQRGTERLTTHQHKMSFQSSHIVRNVVGSGVKYSIQPRSGSEMENAFLENVGYMFFDGAGKLPEVALRDSKRHVYGRSARYKKLVSIGAKLKDALDNYDPTATEKQLGNVKTTPKGIIGVDGIKATLPPILFQDKDVIAYFNTMGKVKDPHKHFIQHMDYLIELAKYDQAIQNGRSFSTSINAMEVDGVSNGLASLFAMLGLDDKLYRVGVKRAQGSERILGNFKDIPNRSSYKGDIRKTLQENLLEAAHSEETANVLFDAAWQRKYGYDRNSIPMLRDIITAATKDKSFLKMPLMTFSYGQEMQNLIGSVYDMLLSPDNAELKTLLENEFPGGLTQGAQFLNDFRNLSLELTLGPEVVAFASAVKRFVEVSALYGRSITLDGPSGGKVSFGGFVTTPDTSRPTYRTKGAVAVDEKGKKLSKKKIQEQIDKTTDPVRKAALERQLARIPKETSIVVTPKKKEFSPYAEKHGMIGARARGSILIAFGQGYDGATMLNVFSGKNWENMTRENKGKSPFVLPIYDAIVTDLGSAKSARKAINNSWFDLTTSGTMLKSLEKSVIGNVHFGRKEYMAKDLNAPIDQDKDGDMVKWIASKLVRLNTVTNEDTKEAGRIFREKLLEEDATYGDLVAAQEFLLKNEYTIEGQSPQEQVGKIVRDAIKKSRKAATDVKKDYDIMGTEAEILQYKPEDIKFSDFLSQFDIE